MLPSGVEGSLASLLRRGAACDDADSSPFVAFFPAVAGLQDVASGLSGVGGPEIWAVAFISRWLAAL